MSFLKKISSNVNKLNELNKLHEWIPNENTIRPFNDDLKNEYVNNLIANYGDLKKGTLIDIFGISNFDNIQPLKLFKENKFRYNTNGNHYVMWYLGYDENLLSDDIISMDIYVNLLKLVGNNNFNFAWYKNPKMTIPDIFHVQVFWINQN
jgi:hypothetical protein